MSVSTSDSVRKKHYSKMAFMLCVPGLMAVANHAWAETEFNIDALDLDERTKIDLSQFADEGYILPGDYYLEIEVNKNKLPLQKIPFYETNAGLIFEREQARGMRLDIPAGTAVRFEPGQSREVELVDYAGHRRVFGFAGRIMGDLD